MSACFIPLPLHISHTSTLFSPLSFITLSITSSHMSTLSLFLLPSLLNSSPHFLLLSQVSPIRSISTANQPVFPIRYVSLSTSSSSLSSSPSALLPYPITILHTLFLHALSLVHPPLPTIMSHFILLPPSTTSVTSLTHHFPVLLHPHLISSTSFFLCPIISQITLSLLCRRPPISCTIESILIPSSCMNCTTLSINPPLPPFL